MATTSRNPSQPLRQSTYFDSNSEKRPPIRTLSSSSSSSSTPFIWNPSTPHTSLTPIPDIMSTSYRSHKSDNGLLGNAGKGIIIGLFSAIGSAVLLGLLFTVLYFFRCTQSGRILLDRLGRPGDYDDEQAFLREEAEALEVMDEVARSDYLRAKAFVEANPPDSIQTDISLSQYLAIQEKGVSAWEFEAELEIANCFVQARTEVEFYDTECAFSVQSNLPLPKHNEVYYWEAKMFELPETTTVAVGLATKPYPLFRLPGFHKHSLAYLTTGALHRSNPFTAPTAFPSFRQGDVIGCGYRPRSGTIFFTRNGKRLDLPSDFCSSSISHIWKSHNLFPTLGATGPAKVHVNLGQSGFVFIEANVKRWGLAPASGTLAPPPPYGSESGSILLESAGSAAAREEGDGYFSTVYQSNVGLPPRAEFPARTSSRTSQNRILPHPQPPQHLIAQGHVVPPPPSYTSSSPARQHGRARTNTVTSTSSHRSRANTLTNHSQRPRTTSFLNATRPPAYNQQPLSPGPGRSPTDISLAPLNSDGSSGDNRRSGEVRRSTEGAANDVNRDFGGPPPEYDSGSDGEADADNERGRLLGGRGD